MKKGRSFKKVITGVIAVAVAVMLGVTMIPQDALAATADLDTSTKYTESLGDNVSTEYAGRIWTDKSVYSEDKSFEMYGGNNTTVTLDASKGEDFLVAFSALATSQSISGQTQAPLDVVFVIDLSGSMSNSNSNMDNDKSRIYNTIQAVNTSIDELMSLNEYTRVGVVGFNSDYEVLLQLDRYTKVTGKSGYFSLNKDTASNNEADLYIDAVNSSGTIIDETTDVSGGTNIQMGLYGGLNMLATETSLYADINGSQVKRIPTVILLSDGSPTYSSGSYRTGGGKGQQSTTYESYWWQPDNNGNDGPGSSPYYGNGMKALMTGAYMKNAVDTHYGVTGTAYETTIYTIGMGITDLPNYEERKQGGKGDYGGQTKTVYTGEQDLAYITLNPEDHWNDDNAMAKAVKQAWGSYIEGNSPSVDVNNNDTYTLSHPSSNDIYTDNNDSTDDTALQDLVDEYYSADKAADVTNVFDEILANIVISAPEVPTELKGTDPTADGYITYTDPIGEYMSVKDVKSIIYAGTNYTVKEKTTSEDGNTTTYVFSGKVSSSVYGEQDISKIIITVVKDADGNETLTTKIPASVIPVRVNTITLDNNGNPTSHTNNGTYPIRVVYSVGLQDSIYNTELQAVDVTKVSEEYIENNVNKDGTVNFYSNLYTANTVTTVDKEGNIITPTVGNATVEFEPSHSNPFYYITEDVALYKDKACTQQVSAAEDLDDNTTYYYSSVYYYGIKKEIEVTARTGLQLKRTDVIEKGGYWYRAKGSPRLNRIMEFEGTKTKNATDTAEEFYLPTFVWGTDSEDTYDGKYVIYLGNNGVISYTAGGVLEISKTVVIGDGLTGPDDQTFKFTVDFNGNATLNGTYSYDIVAASGTVVSSGTIADGETLELGDGQKAVIKNLPNGTTYNVTETEANTNGFTTTSTVTDEGIENGKIETGTTETIAFTNKYDVAPVTLKFDETVNGAKVLSGKPWAASDSFTFVLKSATYDTPMPTPDTEAGDILTKVEGSHQELAVKVTAAEGTADGTSVPFEFGSIEYTEPGTYKYEISERIPASGGITGVSYSGAMYKVVVEVVDNGDGTLSATATMTKDLNDDGTDVAAGTTATSAVFNNIYEADEAYWIPLGTKSYTDTYGTNTITNGMFRFTMTGLDGAPMPDNVDKTTNSLTVRNVGHDIAYEAVKYYTADIGKTYWYKFTEVNLGEAGMSYDTNTYYAKVVVTQTNAGIIERDVTYYESNRTTELTTGKLVFSNTYKPQSVTTEPIKGEKVLTGREWLDSDSFKFNLTAVNDAAAELLKANASVSTEDVVVKADQTFEFGTFTIEKPGTYVFEIDEVGEGTVNGITYDAHKTVVTIEVKDVDGKLVATTTYDNKDVSSDTTKSVFKNTYSATFDVSTAVTVYGDKNLTGKELRTGEFFFKVTPLGDATALAAYNVISVPSGDGIVKLLDNVTYTEAGTYQYLVTEKIPAGATENKYHGTTYDTSVYKLEVTVVDDNAGNLKASWKLYKQTGTDAWTEVVGEGENDPVATFTNAYEVTPVTYAVPTFTKELTGGRATALQADEFSFTMSLVEGDENNVVLPADVKNDANGNISFDAVTFKAAGTYKLQIVENGSDTDIMDYSDNIITAVFVVTDNLDGTLKVERTNISGTNTFTNVYKTEGTVEIPVKKTVTDTDSWHKDYAFTFEVVVNDATTNAAVKAGYISFNSITIEDTEADLYEGTYPAYTEKLPITIKAPGTYEFIIREQTGNIAGLNYDGTSRTVTVIAKDDSKGNLNITYTVDGKTYDADNDGNGDGTILEFVNKYDPGHVELSGHEQLMIKKNFTGRVDNEWFTTDSFTFKIEAADEVTKNALIDPDGTGTEQEAVVILPSNLVVNSKNKANSHFGNITFTNTGTFLFKITEEQGDIPGVTYNTTNAEYYVKVIVTKNSEDASILEITSVTYYDANNAEITKEDMVFANEYDVEEVKVIGETAIPVVKEIVGREWLATDAFVFTLEPYGKDTIAAMVDPEGDENAAVEFEGKTSITLTKDVKESFGNIIFREPGTYQFAVKETKGSDDNITYDSHTAIITVIVTDLGNGIMKAEPNVSTISGGLTFTNTFTPDPIDVSLSGKKVLKGRTLNAGEFHFRIDAITEGAPMPAVENGTVSNAADGSIHFGTIRFTEEGTYQYEISEVQTPVAGVTLDRKDVIATVKVEKNADGILIPTVTYAKEDGSGTEFVFNNTYTTTPTDPVEISARKEVTPTDGNSFTMNGNDFSFEIEPSASNPASDPIEQQIVKNTADGAVFFKNAVYTEAETYVYTVHEVSSSRGGIILDDTVYTVTVVVTDNTSKAKLEADVTITKGTTEVSAMEFNNGYEPTEATVILHGHKNLLGGHKTLTAGEFTFTLEAVTKDAPMPTKATVTNSETGLFQFDKITYTQPGTYEYVISEVEGNEPGMAYDATDHKVTVTVTDNNGVLAATVDGITDADGKPLAVFDNTYIPGAEFVGDIGGTKVLTGRELTEDEFEFALLDETGKEVSTTTNKADGTFAFKNVKFEKAGTYNFTIVEKDTDAVGITYDLKTAYGVKVVIEDKGGQLEAVSIEYFKDGEAIDKANVTFNNSYKAVNPATIKLGAVKTLTGRTLEAGEFSFLLTGTDGTKMIATNGADGSVLFDEIKFTEAGTYEFVITEAKGNDADVDYDESKYTVTVVVTDDLKGNLTAEIAGITVTKDGQTSAVDAVTFVNAYEDPAPTGTSPKTNDMLNIFMLMAVILVAGFGVCGVTVYSRRSKTSDRG